MGCYKMKYRERLLYQMSNVGKAYRRYPLTMLLFVVLTFVNAWNIVDDFVSYEAIVLSLLVAITLSLVTTHLNERFIRDRMKQFMLLGLSIILALVYYFLLPPHDAYYFIAEIRTGVLIFTLLVAFIWIPSVKNSAENFYQYFLAVFKYAFTAILYALILTLGVQAILSTIDYLFFTVNNDYFLHAANLIWTLFATSYFLSLLPETHEYSISENKASEQTLNKNSQAFEITNFLKILINFIVIPLIGIYTLILLIYIGLNITGEFWTDNLLEPMLISYTIVVLLVYLLAANIDQTIANFFRKVFPKILLVIVVFQTISSLLKIRDMGITSGRYYVILFGVFSFIAGLIFSFWPKEKAGYIVPPFIVLALMSLIPPIDAFTVAEKSQKNLLEDTLTNNEMLVQNEVVANNSITQIDKKRITAAAEYLNTHQYMDEISYLPRDFEIYDDFEKVFGFPMTYEEMRQEETMYHYATLDRSTTEVFDISEQDYFVELFIDNYDQSTVMENIQVSPNIVIHVDNTQLYPLIIIENEVGEKILDIALEDLFSQAFEAITTSKEIISQENMTIVAENEKLLVEILALELMDNEIDEERTTSAHLYLFIQLKE